MSTKTIYKRIALIAVATLGAGLLSVAPASATPLTDEGADLTVFAASSTTPVTVAAGTAVTTPIFVGASAALTTLEGFTVIPANTTRPAGASEPTVSLTSTGAAAPFATSGSAPDTSVLTTSGAGLQSTAQGTSGGTLGTITGGVGTQIGTLTITGFDKPGIYTVTVAPNGAGADTAAVVTVYAGYSADAAKPNRLFPTQGSNITSGWAGVTSGQATVRLTGFPAAGGTYYATVTGNATLNSVTEGDTGADLTNSPTNGVNLSGGTTIVADGTTSASAYVDLQLSLGAAGTATVNVVSFNASTGASTVFASATVTIGEAASTSATAAKSTIYAVAGHNVQATSASAALVPFARAAGTDAAGFSIVVKDGYGNPLNSTVVSATVAGPGLIIGGTGTAGNTSPNARVATATTNSSGQVFFNLDADGTAGVSTITFSVGTTTLGTQTVSFYGAAAKYTATVIANAVAGTASQDIVNVAAVDAAGIAIPSSQIFAFSSDIAVATVETSDTTAASAVAAESNPGQAASYVSAKAIGTAGFTVTPSATTTASSVTITFGNASTLAASTVTTTAVVGIGGIEAASVTLTTDKAVYAPGEKMVVTLTLKDKLGRLVGTNVGTTVLGAFASSSALGGDAMFAAGAQITKLGIATKTFYAPLAAGPIEITGKTGTDATHLASAQRGITLTATATVENPDSAAAQDAANEATDAANAATDAALSAADAADAATAAAQDAADAVAALSTRVSKLVSDLRKQIRELTKLVQRLL
jgi:hypothetical protein